ncbi:MAG: AarF/ABC1/UbiB kinase family protein [Pseudomonadota bacterium]
MSSSFSNARAVPIPQTRLARATRMGTMTAGVAGNMALNGLVQLGRGQSPTARDLLLTPGNIRRIADQLARMRGAAMKMGQLMSMDTGEMLPPELADIMARLRADADFMPPKQLQSVLNAAWGEGWRKRFSGFDVRPMAAASIGQVHRARLPDGRDLAIKVQYPGVARSIDSDVTNVGRLIQLSGLAPPGFDLAPYLEEARAQLHQEADYDREARYLAQFHALMAGEAGFDVPQLVPELTTKTVLAMSFVPGVDIEEVAGAAQEVRDRVAERLIALMLRELFTFRLMQTDPNFANYRYNSETGQIVLLDFGAARDLDEDIIARYRAVFAAGLTGDKAEIERAAERMGIITPQTQEPFRRLILEMNGLVFEHVRRADVMDFATSTLSAEMNAKGRVLAETNYVPPPLPMDLLFIQRKVAGMFLLATRLKARVRVRALIEEALA